MKFAIGFATVGAALAPEGLRALGESAEEAGYESLWSVEHVAIPLEYESVYPYSPSGRIDAGVDVPIPDPLVPLGFLASITSRIRLATGVMVLAHHHPLHVAKAVATLDQLSGGRAMLGIGVGWLKEEFDALSLDFDDRGGRTAASVRALRDLWSPGPSQFESRFFSWPALESNPKPLQPGGVPIHVAGHTPISARRAARYGDGYFPAVKSPEELAPLLAVLREECEVVGRASDDIEISVGGTINRGADEIKRFAEVGATRVFANFLPAATPQELRDGCSPTRAT